MRRILHILLLFVLLTVVAGGCRRTDGGEEPRLVAIDSLIASRPDSALALLARVDTAALAEPGRAYHALLTVQAAYRCYVDSVAADTTIINAALAYYQAHPHRILKARALLFKGAASELNGRQVEAMRCYNESEKLLTDDDLYYFGYVNLRIAQILRDNHAPKEMIIERYERALKSFDALRDTVRIIACLQNIGANYRESNPNKAITLLEKGAKIALEYGDSASYFRNLQYMVRGLYFDSAIVESKILALRCLEQCQRYADDHLYYDLARDYAKLGMPDSAEYYFALAPLRAGDSAAMVTRYHTLAHIAYARGQYQKAISLDRKGDELSDRMSNTAQSQQLAEFIGNERKTQELLQSQTFKRLKTWQQGSIALVVVLVLLAVAVFVIVRRRNRALRQSLVQSMRNERVNEHQQLLQRIDQSEEKASQLAQLIRDHVQIMRSLIDMSFHLPGDMFVKAFHKQLAMASKDICFWDCVDFDQLLTDEQRRKIAAISQQSSTALANDELMLMKMVAAGFSDMEICVMMGYKNKDYVRVKLSRIKTKAQLDQPMKTLLQDAKAQP